MKFLLIFLLFSGANSLTLNCTFQYGTWPIFNVAYYCEVIDIIYEGDPLKVVSVLGEHMDGRTSQDVIMVSFSSFNCPKYNLRVVPQDLQKFFPSFAGLNFGTCAINYLTGTELAFYPNLRSFGISYTNLTEVPSKLFKSTPNLFLAYFSYNKIREVGAGTFDGLTRLAQVHFGMNACINKWAAWQGEVAGLVNDLKMKCAAPVCTPSVLPCGTFVRYDTVNGGDDPSCYGFPGGVNWDNSDEYVGYGNNVACNQYPSSGFISPGTPYYGHHGAGAFMPCSTGISFDNVNGHYLVGSGKLQWIMTDTTAMMSLSNVIQIKGNQTMAFGRVLLQGAYRVGKIIYQTSNGGLFIQDDKNHEKSFSHAFEILTCNGVA